MKTKIKQRDITDCGAACLASIAAHYHLGIPVSKIRQMAGTDQKGTNAWGLIKAAEKLGFSAKGVKGGIEALPEIPCPAIAHVLVKKTLLHFVVIYKLSKTRVEYMDPADGEIHKTTIQEFAEIWTGVLILMAPGTGFQPKNEKISIFSRFLFLLQPHKNILLQALLGAVVYTILGLSTSIYQQKITDFVLVDHNTNLLNLLSVMMLFLVIFQLFIGYYKNIFVLQTGQKIDARLILGYYKHLLKLPQYFFDSMRVGEIVPRINDAVKIRAFINDIAISLLVSFFIVIFSFGLMFLYSWKLALVVSIVLPLYGLIYWVTPNPRTVWHGYQVQPFNENLFLWQRQRINHPLLFKIDRRQQGKRDNGWDGCVKKILHRVAQRSTEFHREELKNMLINQITQGRYRAIPHLVFSPCNSVLLCVIIQ